MTNPPNVKTKRLDWAALVRRQAGDELQKKEPAYEFSNGRKFNDTGTNGGPYRQS